jgi:hypothetical protein
MTKVTVDQTLRSKLNGFNGQIELCDEAGRTVGFFLTADEYKRLILEWAKLKYPAEELKRRYQEPGERSTAEVLARLIQT